MTLGIKDLWKSTGIIHEVYQHTGSLEGERQKSLEETDKCCSCLNSMSTWQSGRVFHVKKSEGCYQREILHGIFCSTICATEYFCKLNRIECPVCREGFDEVPTKLLQKPADAGRSILGVVSDVRRQVSGLSALQIEQELQRNAASLVAVTPRESRSFGGDRSNTSAAASTPPKTPKKEILQHSKGVCKALDTFKKSPQSPSKGEVQALCNGLEDFNRLSPEAFQQAFLFAVEHEDRDTVFQMLEALSKAYQGNRSLAGGVLANNKVLNYTPEAQNCIKKLFSSSNVDDSK